ncbi:hypothetical protein ER308_15945 [Egibacter rhizosphaerae]|uniref:Uncharacterized protein n=1 Tax=Egibacter rhizosphaerae TaxID=1670831 RepID=A0A411YIG3_9ACTN|nr:hypothetical protein [Egibacter rhizosphaerae]QBI20919.1 hypothetical protein ER308_15945 [Egibacter rhizosphaerae]
MWPFTGEPTLASVALFFVVVMAASFVVRGVLDNVGRLRHAVRAGAPVRLWIAGLVVQLVLPVAGTVLYLGMRPPDDEPSARRRR